MGTIIVYAPNVGGGGGLVLLRELLRADWGDTRLVAILDRRGRAQIVEDTVPFDVYWVESTILGRWGAELLLSRLATVDDAVLCFHNLPPVLPNRAQIFCYVQNAYVVGLIPVSHRLDWLQVRNALERFIARRFRRRVNRYIVQTPTMAEALRRWFGDGVPPVEILPFGAVGMLSETSQGSPALGVRRPGASLPLWDFIYPSDGPVHKNHRRLFDAWRLLAEQGCFPSLAITLHPSRDTALRKELCRLKESCDVRIQDLGILPHAELIESYGSAGALIFPSYSESFGLPLMEAQLAGLPILAPELDYVRDVCLPSTTFDAFSARSIARAVQRFMGQVSDRIEPTSADAFVSTLREMALDGEAKRPRWAQDSLVMVCAL